MAEMRRTSACLPIASWSAYSICRWSHESGGNAMHGHAMPSPAALRVGHRHALQIEPEQWALRSEGKSRGSIWI